MQPLRSLLILLLAMVAALSGRAPAAAGPTPAPQMAPPALARPDGEPRQAGETPARTGGETPARTGEVRTGDARTGEAPAAAATPVPPSVPVAPGEVLIEGTIDTVAKDGAWLQVSIFHASTPEGAEVRPEAPLPATLLLGVTRTPVALLGPGGERLSSDALRQGAAFAAAVTWPLAPAPAAAPLTPQTWGVRGALLPLRRVAVGLPEAPSDAVPSSPGPELPGPVEPDRISQAPVIVPMLFPAVGRVSWTDTFLASRGGGTRRHRGQDIVAPKMTPVVAAFDGTVYPRSSKGHYLLTLVGDDGWSAEYMHLNNDTPGTDDGKGGDLYAFAPGVLRGARVVAGQLLGWVGDSGNAESTVPHLHFELVHRATGTAVNAAPSLRLARRIAAPRVPEVLPDLEPSPGEARWNSFVRACSTERGTAYVDISARAESGGKVTALTRPQQCTVRFGAETTLAPLGARDARLSLADVAPGSLLVVVGRKVGGEIAARAAFAEATGLVPGAPLLTALASLAPAEPAMVAATVPPSDGGPPYPPTLGGKGGRPPTAQAATPEEELLWVRGYVLMPPFEGSVMIRMDAVRIPGSKETIKFPRALLKEVVLGARTRLRDANGKPIPPEALVTDAEVEVLGEEEGKTAPLYAATLTLRAAPGK